jgi:hypothetical protein
MPTFGFFKNKSCVDTIVGADVSKIRSLLAKYSSGSSFGSGGRVLGSGKVAAAPSKPGTENGNLIFYGLLGAFILYLYFSK